MSRQIIIPIISLGLNSFGGNVIYYALNFSASNTGNSYGTNMCLFGIAEFLSYFPLRTCLYKKFTLEPGSPEKNQCIS